MGLSTPLQTKNTISIHVGLTRTNALVDTGSQLTLASETFLQNSQFKNMQLERPDYDVIKGVGGKYLQILGKTHLPIQIDHKTVNTKIHIVKGLHQSVIIGLDFLEKHHAKIDLASKTIEISECNATVTFQTRSHFARTMGKTVIPPKHEAIIPVKISRLNHNQTILLEPCESLINKSILGAKTISKINKQKASMKICNPTDKEITLPNQSIVGTVEIISDSELIPFSKQTESSTYSVKSQHLKTNKKKQYLPVSFDLSDADLTSSQKTVLKNILDKNRDVFAVNLSELGKSIGRYSHKIETYDAPPVRTPFYRVPTHMQKEIDRQVQELLDAGIIVESNSEFNSPVVLVKKKDGRYRFCIDYRKLNKITKPLTFPLPRLECVFDTIAEAKSQIFSTFDLHSGYWQLQMHPESRHKTAFITQNGVYEWTRVGMGLKNSCVSFQTAMTDILRGLHWKNMLVYVDDICVFSKNFDEHLEHLNELFSRLRKAGMTLNPKKCKFAAKQVKYLGQVISKDGIHVDPDKTKVIDTFPTPKTVKEIRSFLGMCNYYRRFIKSYSSVANPLTKLLRKDEKFVWTEQCESAFQTLKQKLTSAPILAYPNMHKPFILTTDASTTAIGYILSQTDKGKREHVIAYGGRSLSKAERNWSASDIECLAVIEGIREYNTYLSCNEFTVYTDHKPLQYLMKHKGTTRRLARWSLELQGYNFNIVYKEGKSNVVADAISRRTYTENTETNEIQVMDRMSEEVKHNEPVMVEFQYKDSPVATVQVETNQEPDVHIPEEGNLATLQKQCDDFKDIYRFLDEDVLPDESRKRKQVISKAEYYSLCNGVLYHWFQRRLRKASNTDKWIKQLALPKVLRLEAMKAYHDNDVGGAHFGIEKVMAALKQKFHWPKMHQDIYDYIKSCDRCQRTKTDQHLRPPPLTSMPIDGPFERWHMDFLKLSQTKDGHQYLLLVVDSFTRWIEAFPMKTQDSKQVAKVLFEQVFSRYGAPKKIVSDLGKQFTSNLILSLCEIFNVKRHFTSAYHPQTNSFCERNNRTIIQSIRAYCDKDQNNWPSKIPGILMALRNSPCTHSTEHSPYYMAFGREMNLPFDLQVTPKDSLQQDAKEHIQNILENLKITEEIAKQNVHLNQQKSKEHYDKNTKEPSFRLNQMVLLRQHKTPVGKSPKLVDKYDGPYYIAYIGPNYTYKLRDCTTHKELKSTVNASRLKPYTPSGNTRSQFPADGLAQLFEDNDTDLNDTPNDQTQGQNGSNADTSIDQTPGNDSSNGQANGTNSSHDQTNNDTVYPVDKLLRLRKRAGKREFYVKWEDGSKSWEPEENISDILIREYFISHTKSGKKRKRPSLLNRNGST